MERQGVSPHAGKGAAGCTNTPAGQGRTSLPPHTYRYCRPGTRCVRLGERTGQAAPSLTVGEMHLVWPVGLVRGGRFTPGYPTQRAMMWDMG